MATEAFILARYSAKVNNKKASSKRRKKGKVIVLSINKENIKNT